MTWKCMVCETVNQERLIVCEVCDAVRPGIDPVQVTRTEIACVKVESRSPFRSIEEYLYETRSWSRGFEKHLLKATFYAKCFALVFIPLFVYFLIKGFKN